MIYVDLSSLQILSQLEPLRPQLYALLVICLCLCPCLNVTAILSCLPLAAWMLAGLVRNNTTADGCDHY